MKGFRIRLFLVCALVALFPALAIAQPMTESPARAHAIDQAQSLSDSVMSPFCPGLTLSSCPSDQARQLRGEMTDWFQQGMTTEQVRSRLENTYGHEIIGEPAGSGFDMFAWLMPVVFLAFGVLFILFRPRADGSSSTAKPTEHDPTLGGERDAEIASAVRRIVG